MKNALENMYPLGLQGLVGLAGLDGEGNIPIDNRVRAIDTNLMQAVDINGDYAVAEPYEDPSIYVTSDDFIYVTSDGFIYVLAEE